MQAKKTLILFISFLTLGKSYSQEFKGIATYVFKKSMSKMKKDLEASGRHDTKTINKTLGFFSKAFEKTYILTFNSFESQYKEKKEQSEVNNSEHLYKNIKIKNYVHKKAIAGKSFLIKDTMKPYEWEISSKTKKIGDYNCFLATTKININKNHEQLIKAWYTPDIPISNGPSSFWGLPGLILELNTDDGTILCSEIEINSTKIAAIKIPKGGKKVTQMEFDIIKFNKDKEKDLKRSHMENMERGYRKN